MGATDDCVERRSREKLPGAAGAPIWLAARRNFFWGMLLGDVADLEFVGTRSFLVSKEFFKYSQLYIILILEHIHENGNIDN